MWDAQIALIGAVANLADLGRAGEHNGGYLKSSAVNAW